MENIYDLIIVGAGPAGLSASIYASRYGMKHLVFSEQIGGTIVWAHKVENYPGIFGLSGTDLAQKFFEHAKILGGVIENKEVIEIKKEQKERKDKKGTEEVFKITTSDNIYYFSKAVILAMGTKRRELGVTGEKKLVGKGVSYCSTCDAAFFKGKTVAVVGGANAACSGASHVSKFAKKVFLLYRKNALKAEPSWIKEIEEKENIEILYETNVTEIKGTNKVEKVILDKPHNGTNELLVSGVFVEIGGVPVSKLATDLGVTIDKDGYVETNKDMSTNIAGLYCAGDLNSFWKEFQQVITATTEGAIAANSVYQNLKK